MKKSILIVLLAPLLLTTQCEEPCDTIINNQRMERLPLVDLQPMQDSYRLGDTLVLRVDFPADNDYFGTQLDLFEQTEANSALLSLSFPLSDGNTLFFRKGAASDNLLGYASMPYHQKTDHYKLDLAICLQRPGDYLIDNFVPINLGGDDCPAYTLNTQYVGVAGSTFRFTVQE